ncbi:MAG: LysE family translocator [Pseudomonadota bacterium]
MSLDLWAVFLISAYGLAVYPGPNNLLALSNGTRAGARPAIVGAALGRLSAFILMIAATAVGLGALLAASELAFLIVKWCGVAYLLYLGVRILTASPAATDDAIAAELGLPAIARREFLVAIGNPKAILIFTAFFPQFLDPAAPAIPQFAAMGGAFLLLEFSAIAVYAAGGAKLSGVVRSETGRRWMNRATGGALIGAAGLLAASQRNA